LTHPLKKNIFFKIPLQAYGAQRVLGG
jgi:hypothetical protein